MSRGVLPADVPALRAYVGLGGNLGDRLATLRAGARALAHHLPRTQLVAASPVYETRPIGPSSEPFLNAVAELRTHLPPLELLESMLDIERQHGRTRHGKWEARTLDLDLLLLLRPTADAWAQVETQSERLCVPHPRMLERDFVLVPLVDLLGPRAQVSGRALGRWLERLGQEQRTILRRLDEGLIDAADGGLPDGEAVIGSRASAMRHREGG
ncbi:MAG: 2-amino-4-hydroxy-6-hydroxymethyldihydropteridine diphosphokinase [Myxococcales bacterium]|nr:2-amino-4-hydroxy-6-hydroxymethyldihydropteridine diphosphokinase [Myxococcales bacterium]